MSGRKFSEWGGDHCKASGMAELPLILAALTVLILLMMFGVELLSPWSPEAA